MKIGLQELYWIFFKISLVLIGGGYVLIPISLQEFAEKRKLLSKEEIIDFYSLSQCLPGIITVKVAVLIGYHLRGKLGAISSILGIITPPFFAILFVAHLLNIYHVQFASVISIVTISVIVLVGSAFFELAGVCLKNIFSVFLFLVTIGMFLFTKMAPVTIIVILTVFGMILKNIIRKFERAK